MTLFGLHLFGRNDSRPVRNAMRIQEVTQPMCAACGRPGVTAHHIIPVHIAPANAAELDNLISLCPRCHLVHGHAGDWRKWVPNVREVLALRRIES